MFAYTDESGNTGLRLFDEQQPAFLTLTLVSSSEVDAVLAPRHAEWLVRTGVARLHANELGMEKLESIADSARQFVELTDPRFILTFIHKPYFGAVKFVDAVLDNGVNNAVTPLHYGIRGLRLPLAVALVQSMSQDDVVAFWDAWGSSDVVRFAAVAKDVRAKLRGHPDPRVVELLSDALGWAERHPAAVMGQRRQKLDAPNIVALTLIVGVLHALVGTEGGRVLRFVHDRQQQFGTALKEVFDVVRQLAPTRSGPTASIIDLEIVKTFGCPIELQDNGTSPTLQLVDVLLWLFRRRNDLLRGDAPACAQLLEAMVSRCVVSEFSFQQLVRDARAARAELDRLPFSAVDAARGKHMLDEIERVRRQRASEPPDEDT